MKVKRIKTDGERLTFRVEASAADVDRAFDIAHVNFCQRMGIALDGNISPAQAAKEQQGIGNLDAVCAPMALESLVPFALDGCGVYPAFLPQPPAGVLLRRGESASFTLEVVKRPAFELSSYDPVEVEVHPFTYDSAPVDAELERIAQQFATFEESDERRAVRSGDAISVSFSCSLEGCPIERLKADHRTYLVGSGAMPKDFDDHVVGMNVGETQTFAFEATDHEGLSTDMRTYESTLTVHSLLNMQLPVIDDDWVCQNAAPYTTREQLREALASQLDGVRRAQYDDYVRSVVATELAKRLVGQPSMAVLEGAARTFAMDLRQQVAASGMSWPDFVSQSGGEQKLSQLVAAQTHQTLVECYALDALFKHEKLSIDDGDIFDVCAQISPANPKETREMMEGQGFGYTLRESAERYCANRIAVERARISIVESVPDGSSSSRAQ